jgi:hypothetical protein
MGNPSREPAMPTFETEFLRGEEAAEGNDEDGERHETPDVFRGIRSERS